MASSNIELYCKNEGITKLFLTGSEIERMKKEWITKLTEHLKASGIQVVYGENICYKAYSFNAKERTDIACQSKKLFKFQSHNLLYMSRQKAS